MWISVGAPVGQNCGAIQWRKASFDSGNSRIPHRNGAWGISFRFRVKCKQYCLNYFINKSCDQSTCLYETCESACGQTSALPRAQVSRAGFFDMRQEGACVLQMNSVSLRTISKWTKTLGFNLWKGFDPFILISWRFRDWRVCHWKLSITVCFWGRETACPQMAATSCTRNTNADHPRILCNKG
jgi:hypothetical protein